MKIFSWVHRRFNNKAENVKKNGSKEEQYFPAEDKCDDVFESWRGGILTIGTFGYDPLKDDQNVVNADYDDDSENDEVYDDNGDDVDEEHNPLVLSAFSFNAEESMGFTEIEMEETWSHADDELKFGFEYVMMKKKERTTLADLFCADSDTNTNTNTNTKKQTLNKSDLVVKDKSNRKQGTKDARPIHKLNQLLRRMLKRKIHPDVGPTNPKVAAGNSNICSSKCRTSTDDFASLLPTQGADHI